MNETAEPAVVICDANVLYSIVMTDLIISLGCWSLLANRSLAPSNSRWSLQPIKS
jgi:hypothetical protein